MYLVLWYCIQGSVRLYPIIDCFLFIFFFHCILLLASFDVLIYHQIFVFNNITYIIASDVVFIIIPHTI